MKINPVNDNRKTRIDNVALALTTLFGVGGAAAGVIIPESAGIVAAIQAAAYFPALFAAVLKRSISGKELSEIISKQIKECSSDTAKQYLEELKTKNAALYYLFNSMWSSDVLFDPELTLDTIETKMADFISKEAYREGYDITNKDINDALNGYKQCFFVNLSKHSELNQVILHGHFQVTETLIRDLEVIKRRLEFLENAEQQEKVKFDEGKQILLNYANAQADDIKKRLIFPWFNESKSLRDVFPKLFVTPKLINEQTKERISDLTSYVNKNLMILGEAGTGKSTLLNYWFAFENKELPDSTICLYFGADSTIMNGSAFNRDFKFASKDLKQHYLIIIDGVDETYLLRPSRYQKLILKLKTATNCNFWLGCRQDFYSKYLSDKTKISDYDLVVQEWNTDQISFFINEYSNITENQELLNRIECIKKKSRNPDGIETMMKNPFQLSVLVFLAEQAVEFEINSTFDLYEQFIELWIEKEINRNTSPNPKNVIYDTLYDAAKSVYYKNEYIFNEIAENNTAVNGLLQMKSRRRGGKRVAKSFYHRSLAAFLIANRAYQAVYEGNIPLLVEASEARSRDDITNFLIDKFATISISEKNTIKRNIIYIYQEISDKEGSIAAKQQLIYYITRLGIDVSDFIVGVIRENPSDRYMRLSLAYGCVLANNNEMRQYALAYARSIAEDPNGDDAVTNRGWTTVYFNDVNIDEQGIDIFDYRDTIKGSWKYSREARINRFTKKNPRIKDLRFWIFDIPLFHSFLIDRNWDNLSVDEYKVLENLRFENNAFDDEEIGFLTAEREKLLIEYKAHLEQNENET